MLRNIKFFQSRLFETAILLLVSALVYLPNIGGMSYYKDDWYYIHDAFIAGPAVFLNMFAIDRPARGPFFQFFYSVFGYQPLPYHIGMFAWRCLAVIGALWLFNILWPRERRIAFGAALLFAIYPGFLWWVKAVEDQPIIASLALQVFSVVFTLKALQSAKRWAGMLYTTAAILTGWAYIALVDYAIGMEIFRFLCVFILVRRDSNLQASPLWKSIGPAVRRWWIYLTIPIGFLVWREFFFTNTRRATDMGTQLGVLVSSPVSTLMGWMINLARSVLNVGLFAWVTPFVSYFFDLRLHDVGVALFITALVILVVVARNLLWRGQSELTDAPNREFFPEALWLGLLGTVFGVLPIVIANRYVVFQAYSHYALPASLAGVVLVTGLVNSITFGRVRSVIMLMLVAVASLTHYAVSIAALNEEQAIQKFWWQMVWRAPGIQRGTTLIVNYPPNLVTYGAATQDPADLLYYPQKSSSVPVQYALSAATAGDDTMITVLTEQVNRNVGRRSHVATLDFGDVLVLSQPANASCVHVIDSQQPVLSVSDPGYIQVIASASKVEDVLSISAPAVPLQAIFGPEPAHQWCYYYEKMELAIQQGDWKQAVTLGNKAIELGLHPEDQAEWIPLAMAYAVQSDVSGIKLMAPKINSVPFLRVEACQLLGDGSNLSSYTPAIQTLLSQSFCRSGK